MFKCSRSPAARPAPRDPLFSSSWWAAPSPPSGGGSRCWRCCIASRVASCGLLRERCRPRLPLPPLSRRLRGSHRGASPPCRRPRARAREGRASPPPRTRPNVASANAAPRDALTASTSARGRPTTRAGTSPTSARRVAHRPGRVVAGSFTGPTRYPRTLAPTKRSRERPARWDGAARGLVEDRRAGAPRASSTNIATSATRAGDEGQAANPRETVGRSDSIANATRAHARDEPFFSRGRLVVRGKRRHASGRRARDGETRRSARRARGGGGCGGGGVLAQIEERVFQERLRAAFHGHDRGGFGFSHEGFHEYEYFYTPRDRPSGANRSTGTRVPVSAASCAHCAALDIAPGTNLDAETLKASLARVREALAPGRARLGGR